MNIDNTEIQKPQIDDLDFMPEHDIFDGKCSIELKREIGLAQSIELQSRESRKVKTRRAPQSAEDRATSMAEVEAALAIISRIEAVAGPTLEREVVAAKAFQAAHATAQDRKQAVRRLLGQRNGLLKLMQCEWHHDYPSQINGRSRLYVEYLLRLSANVAGLSGSGWSSTWRWMEKRLPLIASGIGEDAMKADFLGYLSEVKTEIVEAYGRCPLVYPPASIAESLQITTEQLRYAEATNSGLTSIDRDDRKTRDRKRKERQRRATGAKPQSERTRTASLQALADLLGCHLSTVKRHDRAGDLVKLVAGRDDLKVSALLKNLMVESFRSHLTMTKNDQSGDGGTVHSLRSNDNNAVVVGAEGDNPVPAAQTVPSASTNGSAVVVVVEPEATETEVQAPTFDGVVTDCAGVISQDDATLFASAPANDDKRHDPAPSPLIVGYIGRTLQLTAQDVQKIVSHDPILGDDIRHHLDTIDFKMRKTLPQYRRSVLSRQLNDQRWVARRAKRKAA